MLPAARRGNRCLPPSDYHLGFGAKEFETGQEGLFEGVTSFDVPKSRLSKNAGIYTSIEDRIRFQGRKTEMFDSSVSRQPVRFEVGHGQAIQGIEEEVIGMNAGEEKKVCLSPEKGFGEHREGLIQSAPKEIFQGQEIVAGDIVDLRSAEGQLAKATIVNVAEDQVTFDLNHPLAGKNIIVKIELVEVA